VDYSAAQTVIEASREELTAIFQWLQSREGDPKKPLTVLIGGWAVYFFNPWYGSIDIDIVTNSRTRHHLMKFLRDERGFVPERHPMIPNTVVKNTPAGQILIDFASRDDVCRFVGRDECCPFKLLDGQTDVIDLEPGCRIPVPTRTLLLVFKLKAAWDRSQRLQNETSRDPEWEQGKVRKDRADILALIDPTAGGTDIDIQYLGSYLRENLFLFEVLEQIPLDNDAVAMYGRLSSMETKAIINRLCSLVK
jgi:hypothetical protein